MICSHVYKMNTLSNIEVYVFFGSFAKKLMDTLKMIFCAFKNYIFPFYLSAYII